MILLPQEQRAAIKAHVEADYPNEACGLLLGRRRGRRTLITSAVASANLADQPDRRFEVDPGLRLRLQRAAREAGDSVIGHYHSHPDGDAQPSQTDAGQVFEPDLVWLIAAVGAGEMLDVAAFMPLPEGNGFRRVALAVDEEG